MKRKLIIFFWVDIIIVFGLVLAYVISYKLSNENAGGIENKTKASNESIEVIVNDLGNNEVKESIIEEDDDITNLQEEVITEEMNDNEEIKVNIIVNNKTFTASLYNNETVKELISHFPLTLNMSELNSNEKYNYLDFSLVTDTYAPGMINAGDIKLYGNNCLVIFYDSFESSYSYTDIGKIDNVNEFVKELGSGNVTMTFKLN